MKSFDSKPILPPFVLQSYGKEKHKSNIGLVWK